VIEVIDQGAPLAFTFPDLLRYAGPGSPAGVAVSYQAMRLSFSQLNPDGPVERREMTIDTAFRGPGARDGFELVTRAVTEGRYHVTNSLERPGRGITLEQFVFRFVYRDRALTLLVRDGMISDQFIALARTEGRSAEDERRFTALKQAHAERLLATPPADIFDLER
jgi:hypothetical protein